MSAPLNKEEVGDNFYRKSKSQWKNEEGGLRVGGQVWSKNSPFFRYFCSLFDFDLVRCTTTVVSCSILLLIVLQAQNPRQLDNFPFSPLLFPSPCVTVGVSQFSLTCYRNKGSALDGTFSQNSFTFEENGKMFEFHCSLPASQLVQTLVMRLWHFCVSFMTDIKLKPCAIRLYWTFQMFISQKSKRNEIFWMETGGTWIKCWWKRKHVLATRNPGTKTAHERMVTNEG